MHKCFAAVRNTLVQVLHCKTLGGLAIVVTRTSVAVYAITSTWVEPTDVRCQMLQNLSCDADIYRTSTVFVTLSNCACLCSLENTRAVCSRTPFSQHALFCLSDGLSNQDPAMRCSETVSHALSV